MFQNSTSICIPVQVDKCYIFPRMLNVSRTFSATSQMVGQTVSNSTAVITETQDGLRATIQAKGLYRCVYARCLTAMLSKNLGAT